MQVKSGMLTRLGKLIPWRECKKFALRMCTKQWNSSYNDLYTAASGIAKQRYTVFWPRHWLQLCSLPTLQQHRLYLDLCTVFKIVQDLFHFPTGIFVEQTLRVTKLQSHHLFVCPHAHTSTFYISFVPHTIRNWNMFTAHVPLPTSVSSFKSNLWAYMRN